MVGENPVEQSSLMVFKPFGTITCQRVVLINKRTRRSVVLVAEHTRQASTLAEFA